MRLFPVLPVLRRLEERLAPTLRPIMPEYTIVAVQHLLESTGSLVESLLSLGVMPEKMHFLGKPYSTSDSIVQRLGQLGVRVHHATRVMGPGCFGEVFQSDIQAMWRSVCAEMDPENRGIIILDDGGRCLAVTPPCTGNHTLIAGVEQTTSGLRQLALARSVPVVQVASSAVKRLIEPKMVAEAVLAKIRALLPPDRSVDCGVVGMGNIGRAIAAELRMRSHRVCVFDQKPVTSPDFELANSLQEVFDRSQYLFGCTGSDFLEGANWLEDIVGDRILASCSSEDVEFASLLRSATTERVPPGQPFGPVVLRGPRSSLTVLRSGFPVNFDGSSESVPSSDIQVTRGLLLGGVAQAALCASRQWHDGRPLAQALNSELQSMVVSTWLAHNPQRRQWYPSAMLDSFADLRWVTRESGGDEVECPLF